jgi:pyridoxal phosphate enzyme (YggS family)
MALPVVALHILQKILISEIVPNLAAYRDLTALCGRHHARLVVVTKTRTIAEIMELYDAGHRRFGENRVQELLTKAPDLPKDIEWHLIGHLQSNKVKSLLPVVSLIQSLDSETLWRKVHQEASTLDQTISCLLQIKIAMEATKYGWDFGDLISFLDSRKYLAFSHVRIEGVMGMGTLTDREDITHEEMRHLKSHFDFLKKNYFKVDPHFRTISMGMTGDYKIALEEGSNMLRVGSLLF